MLIHILEDSKILTNLLQSILKIYGYTVRTYTSKDFDSSYVERESEQLVLIDTKLDHINPDEIIKDLRAKHKNLYIIGINSASNFERKIDFLKNGADDVLSYPFPMQELLARIQALLRRPRHLDFDILKTGDIRVDTATKRVFSKNQEVKFRKREYALLEYLVRNKDRTISRNELMDNVWDYRRIISSNTIDVHVKRVRDKLSKNNFIETVHGYGYRLKDKPQIQKESEELGVL